MWRERTFFLVTREGFNFYAGHESKLLSETELRQMPQSSWHPETCPPLHTWLANSQGSLDKQRLHAIGNIVQPNVARLAMHLLATN